MPEGKKEDDKNTQGWGWNTFIGMQSSVHIFGKDTFLKPTKKRVIYTKTKKKKEKKKKRKERKEKRVCVMLICFDFYVAFA